MTLKRITIVTTITLALAASLTFGLLGNHSANAKVASAAQVSGVTMFFIGANNNTLYRLDPGSTTATRVAPINNVNGTVTEGDFRTATNVLYIVTNAGGLYTLNTSNGQTQQVASLNPNNNTSQMVDINPMADAFRYVGTNELNYAITKGTNGVFNTVAVQTQMAYIAGDPNSGRNPNIVAGTYNNNQNGLATTTFYFADSATNKLGTINGRTNGSSNTGGGRLQTVGTLYDQSGPVTITQNAGMDTATFPRQGNVNVTYLVTDSKLTQFYDGQIPNSIPVGQQLSVGGISQTLVGSDGNRTWSDVMIPIQQ
jgi:uncharacterized protein DUF4394